MKNKEGLKPCPFCGNPNAYFQHPYKLSCRNKKEADAAYVACPGCGGEYLAAKG